MYLYHTFSFQFLQRCLISLVVGIVALYAAGIEASTTDNNFGKYLLSSETSVISMELDGAKLADVLKLLSKKTGLNFVPAEGVKAQKVTLYLDNVPLDEALTTLFAANKLTYDFYPTSNIFVVKDKAPDAPDVQLMTKVYYLKYARIKSSRLNEEIKNKNDSSTSSSSGSGTNVLTNTNTNSTSQGTDSEDSGGLKKIIEKVLTKDGKVTEESRMNALIVTDRPYQFATIDSVISQLDRATPKVLIEVEILDVDKNLSDKLGFTYGNGNGFAASYTPGTFKSRFPFAKHLDSLDSDTDRAIKPALTAGTFKLGDGTNPIVAMQFLKSNTKTKIVARPKILTLSNETAELKIVTNAVTGLTSTATSTGTTTGVLREEVGTVLRVTPQINPDTQEITLYVEASVRDLVDSGLAQTGLSGGNLKNPSGRQTKSVLRLQNGETLLIGGLISKSETKSKDKIPVLGDIPFVGAAFRNKDNSTEDREMLVFITPRIVDDGKSLASVGTRDFRRQARASSKISAMKNMLDRYED